MAVAAVATQTLSGYDATKATYATKLAVSREQWWRERKVLTTNEIAEIFRVHQRTVQRWISSNRLKATKVGSKILRVCKQDLDEFLERQNQDHQEKSET